MSTKQQSYAAGSRIYASGAPGRAWRVQSGSVRLDRISPEGDSIFANLAVTGDVIGAETLMFQHYTFEATALADCVLTPWPEGNGAPAGESLLAALTSSETRTADVVALRGGQAMDRVVRLLKLLTGTTDLQPVGTVLPSRRDMADITALTTETVSRVISSLRRAGLLEQEEKRGRPVRSAP